jgi:hypothetical protein
MSPLFVAAVLALAAHERHLAFGMLWILFAMLDSTMRPEDWEEKPE